MDTEIVASSPRCVHMAIPLIWDSIESYIGDLFMVYLTCSPSCHIDVEYLSQLQAKQVNESGTNWVLEE